MTGAAGRAGSDLALLLAVSAAWAAGYLFIGEASRQVPPIIATAFMTLVAAVVMLPLVRFGMGRDLLQPLRRLWVPLVMALSAIALPNLAVVVAEESIPPELGAVLGTAVPIFTLLLTTFVTRETPLSLPRMLGAAIALAGLVVFVGPGEILGNETELGGIAIMLSGGLVFALNGIFVDRQTADLDDAALAAWTIAFGALALTAAAFAAENPLHVAWTPEAAGSLVAEGVLGMGLAYLGYYVLVARAGAWFASLYAFLVPPLGVLAGILFLGESLTLAHGLGLTIVLGGLWLLRR